VTALPTVAVFSKGKIIDQFVGLRKPEEIKEFIEQSIKCSK
jgi:thioredoxin-like negative regulator of GroEL